MTAPPKPPEAAGLEVVGWEFRHKGKSPWRSVSEQAASDYARFPESYDVRATVTAASAQAAIDALRAENDVLKVEVLGLRAAIFGSHDYDPALRHGNFIEMARATEDGRQGALASATAAEARADRLAKALEETKNRVREWPIDDHETCMCGSPVASHGMGDGHSPVSQGDHAISMIVEAIDEAIQQETRP